MMLTAEELLELQVLQALQYSATSVLVLRPPKQSQHPSNRIDEDVSYGDVEEEVVEVLQCIAPMFLVSIDDPSRSSKPSNSDSFSVANSTTGTHKPNTSSNTDTNNQNIPYSFSFSPIVSSDDEQNNDDNDDRSDDNYSDNDLDYRQKRPDESGSRLVARHKTHGSLTNTHTSGNKATGSVRRSSSSTARIAFPYGLAFPSVHLTLSNLLSILGDTSSHATADASPMHVIPPYLRRQWAQDVVLAVDHLLCSGFCFTWLDPDYLFITSTGRLQIGGLQSAFALDYLASPASISSEPAASTKKTPSKKDALLSRGSNGNKQHISAHHVPEELLHLVAPEILFGGECTVSSAVYAMATLCFLLLAGRPFIKVCIDAITAPVRGLLFDL